MAIVKEVAPTKDAATDAELGVGDFQNKYFGSRPTYMDREQSFFHVLGAKPFSLWTLLGRLSLNPFSGFGLGVFGERWKKQGIEQNLKGDYRLKGGVILYSADGTKVWQQNEEETKDLPYDYVIAAVRKLTGGK